MKLVPVVLGIIAMSAGSSFAQSKSPTVSQQVQNSLEQAGYKDIQIAPESLLVHAKNKNGDPVMMVINPDSVTTITEVVAKNGNSGSSSGQGSGESGRQMQDSGNGAGSRSLTLPNNSASTPGNSTSPSGMEKNSTGSSKAK